MNDVESAAEHRCYLCERALGNSWCILTDKQCRPIPLPEKVGMHIEGQVHRCHYTCALEWLKKRNL